MTATNMNTVKCVVQHLVAAVMLATIGTLPASAQTTMEDAEAAYLRGDYVPALAGFRPYAEQGYTASSMRDFQRVIERENAVAGVYITLEKVTTRGARQAVAEMGTIQIGARTYPKLQIWSVEELLEGTWPSLPDMADPYTGKRVRQAELFE